MSKYTCSNADCTIAVTGKCVLSHTPIESCPNVRVGDSTDHKDGADAAPAPSTIPIHHGYELGPQQVNALLSAGYGHLIGVLGATGTGKTCLLSSLYLLASCGELRPYFLFAGSATLRGFEDRLRLLRKWSETQLPEQIVVHTNPPGDPRQPGFLHLALLQTGSAKMVRNLFFTDLPGEWTTNLIKRAAESENFRFLRRADAVIVTITAPSLLAQESRNSQIQSARILFQRLRDTIGIDSRLPLALAMTRCDQSGTTIPPAIYQIIDAALELGFVNVSNMPVAAFSDRPDVPSGMGIASLLETIIKGTSQSFSEVRGFSDESRMFARYRFLGGIRR